MNKQYNSFLVQIDQPQNLPVILSIIGIMFSALFESIVPDFHRGESSRYFIIPFTGLLIYLIKSHSSIAFIHKNWYRSLFLIFRFSLVIHIVFWFLFFSTTRIDSLISDAKKVFNFTLHSLSLPFEQRRMEKLPVMSAGLPSGGVPYDIILPVVDFILKVTPPDAVILIPPQDLDPMTGNAGLLRYFIYPRFVVNGGESDLIPHVTDQLIPKTPDWILYGTAPGWPPLNMAIENQFPYSGGDLQNVHSTIFTGKMSKGIGLIKLEKIK